MKHLSSYQKIFEGGKYTAMYEIICDLDFFCKDLTDQGFTYRMYPDPHIWNIEKMVDSRNEVPFFIIIKREEDFLVEDVIDDVLLIANYMKKNTWDSIVSIEDVKGNNFISIADTRKFDVSKKSEVDDIVDKVSVIPRKIDEVRIRFL